MEIKELLKNWSDRIGISVEDLQKEFDERLVEEKEIQYKNKNDDEDVNRVIKRMRSIYGRYLKSPAIVFEGIVFACSGLIDYVANKRKFALETFDKDPEKAIREGLTNEKGMPLYTARPEDIARMADWQKERIGTILPENDYSKKVYGVAIQGDSSPQKFILDLKGKVALQDVPLHMPVTFRANNKTKEGDTFFTLNSSVFTEFRKTEIEGLPETSQLIEDFFKSDTIKLVTLLKEYNKNPSDIVNKIITVRGEAVYLNIRPDGRGLMRLEDKDDPEWLNDLTVEGDVACWIPESINVDFGQGSKVYVFARVGEGKKRMEDGTYSDEEKDVNLNVMGIYAIPEFKVGGDSVETQEVTEKDISDDGEEEEDY